MRSPFMHFENTPLRDELGDVRLSAPVPKSERPRAPSSWLRELARIAATRLILNHCHGRARQHLGFHRTKVLAFLVQ
jgi:hypothetical protein